MHTQAARFARPLVAVGGLCLMVLGCKDLKPVEKKSAAISEASKVKVDFYVMSKCPYGTQVEKAIQPVLEKVGNYVDFNIDYIVSEQGKGFKSLHGQPEVDGNIVQLCVMEHYPDPDKYMKFLACQNENMRQIPNRWETCVSKAGLDKAKIQACYKGEQGKKLLRESMNRAQAAKASGSPTIFVAGERYSGGRSETDFIRAICNNLKGNKPEECSKIPEPVEVKALVLTDKRCKECQTSGLESNLRGRFFPKLTVKTVDYATEEGKKLYKELNLKFLPAWLFEPGVEKAERYASIQRWMRPAGKYKRLQVPAKFDPTAEICDNKKDDTGNGKVDCKDETCKGQLVCRDEIKRKLDVFIMSQCPYGVKAVDSMKEVLQNFKGKLDFDVHYIADKTESGFKALHGQSEVDENIRQLCAKKYYGRNNKYLDYMWCRNKNYRSNDWQQCAKTAGLSAKKIEKCATGPEGKKLLAEDIKIAKALNISGSPTWLANNRYKFSGIAANDIKSNFCQRNPGLPNCEKKLTSDSKVSGSCN